MKKSFFLVFFINIAFLSAQNFHKYVNPMIGTGGHGHTYPGATVPFGMVQLSPDTRIDGSWDGCSGYHYDDSIIYGFSHAHLNGTGCSDYGDIMLMPTMGKHDFIPNQYGSTFSHSNEKATAGFYSVKLDKHNIDVKLTTSTRVGFHEYTFNNSGQANIILDLNHRDKLLYDDVKIIAKNFGKLPDWHQGAGGDAFIFIDEITINEINKDLQTRICPQNLYFNKNDFELTDVVIVRAERLFNTMKEYPSMKIEIRSYCDSHENNKLNLSKKRAESIYNYLIENGIDKNRVSKKHYSDEQPVNDCHERKDCSEEELKQNRRCEIIITAL